MMGYDAWSDGESKKVYLAECRASEKYKSGKWYVLADDERLVSSLVVYTAAFGFPPNYCGTGSVSTEPQMRNNGYASRLLLEVCKNLRSEGFKGVYLHADVDSSFYERLGFVVIAENKAKCMVLPFTQLEGLPAEIPSYL